MKTFANGRSILHKGDNLTHTAAPPDVCKTPSPAGPVPIPYVNVAMDSSLASGTKKVKVEGKMAAHEKANISTSMGDEPGTAGGLLSSKFKGKLTWATCSPTVKLEGKGAVRFMDVAQHNGNSFNTAFISLGSPGLAYADDFEGQCEICGKDPDTHRVLTKKSSIDLCVKIIDDLQGRAAACPSKNQARKRGLDKGFMVGAMICKCGLSHVAKSGHGNAEFEAAGAAAGADDVITSGPQPPHSLTFGNTPADENYPNRDAIVRQRFRLLEKKYRRTSKGGGYNIPGSCAGPKLLACGHAPAEMTEMFFNSKWQKEPWTAVYSVLRTEKSDVASGSPAWQQRVLKNLEARRELTAYESRSEFNNPDRPGVASCQTCQELLYLLTCDVDDWSC